MKKKVIIYLCLIICGILVCIFGTYKIYKLHNRQENSSVRTVQYNNNQLSDEDMNIMITEFRKKHPEATWMSINGTIISFIE